MAPRWLLVSDQPAFWHLDAAIVGSVNELLRHGETERLSGLKIDCKLKFCRKLNRQILRFRAFQNAVDIPCCLAFQISQIYPVGDQATCSDPKSAVRIDSWNSVLSDPRKDQIALRLRRR